MSVNKLNAIHDLIYRHLPQIEKDTIPKISIEFFHFDRDRMNEAILMDLAYVPHSF